MIRTLLRHSITYMLPTLLTRGMSFVLLPIYARALTPSDYGVIDLIGTVGPIVNVILCLEIVQGYVRQRVEVNEDDRPRLTGTAWIFCLTAYAAFLLVVIPGSDFVARIWFGSSEWTSAVTVGALSVTLVNLMNMFIGQFRWELRSGAYSIVASVYSILSIVLAAWLALGLKAGVVGILMGQCIAAAVVALVTIYLVRDSWSVSFDITLFRRMFRYSWPLIPASLGVFTSLYLNRVALSAFASLNEVGLYGMGARLASIATLLTAAMQGAVTPLVYAHYKDPETPEQLARIFDIAVAATMATCVALQLFSKDLVVRIATPTYLPSAELIPLIAPALIIAQMYAFAPGIALAEQTLRQLGITLAAAACSVVGNLVLVPSFGAQGAALATLASSVVFFGLWVIVSQRAYPIPFHTARLLWALALYLTSSAIIAVTVQFGPTDVKHALVKASILTAFCGGLVVTGLVPRREIGRMLQRDGRTGRDERLLKDQPAARR